MSDEVIVEADAEAAIAEIIVEDEDDVALPPRAKRQADGSIELTLRYPIVLKIKSSGSDQVREDRTERLTFRRMTGKQLLDAQSSGGNFMRILSAKSAGLSEAKMSGLLDRMDASDAMAVMQVVQVFTGTGQRTGL